MGEQRERDAEAERFGDLVEIVLAHVCLDGEKFEEDAVRVTRITPK
jgi:hypothetical protein